ncbi:unnamed protein product, partial [Allacma fusca]
PGEF